MRKQKKSKALTSFSGTSTQTLPQPSTSHSVHEEGKFNKAWQKGLFRVTLRVTLVQNV